MSLLPCIYCRRTDVPRTREHVLQATFGAAATLPDQVCGDCNSAFSSIDKYFSDVVDFFHLGKNIMRRYGIGRAQLEDGTTLAARLQRNGHGEFLPQYREIDESTWRFTGHRDEDHDMMLAELAEPSRLEVSSRVYVSKSGASELSFLRSGPWKYLVQGTDQERVQKLCVMLKTTGFRPDRIGTRSEGEQSNNSPPIEYDLSVQLDLHCRALAKVALNFVCYRLGPEVALHPEFDSLRNYARWGTGHFADFVVPTLLNHSIEEALSAFISAQHHGLYLLRAKTDEGERIGIFVAVCGKTVGRVDVREVSLSDNPVPQGTWLFTRFDPTNKTVEDFRFPDDLVRAIMNPSALGAEFEGCHKYLTATSLAGSGQ